jgi:hypothetical protein
MSDTVKGRRTKKNQTERASSTKEDVQALVAAADGLPREALAEVLGKRFKSVSDQRAAIRDLIKKFGGSSANKVVGQATSAAQAKERRR